MSPLVWDLRHVGSQEELWLVRGRRRPGAACAGDRRALRRVPAPRAARVELPLLTPRRPRGTSAEVRDKALDVLDATPAARPAVWSTTGSRSA
jgi:iron(II)-dependent oxidoreductase